jgi:glycosyltransferase involved in cell wall biosynthesis
MKKIHPILPPVELASVTPEDRKAFRQKFDIQPEQRLIGMAARLATEKGVEYLIEAMPDVLKTHPTARVLHMGQYQNVLGEEQYARKLAPMIEQLGPHWTFLGVLSEEEKAAFFHTSEVLVLPSINSTESFGMVQVEAMFCGTPAVASDLPGVRCAVQDTGMGKVVPPRDPHSLAEAIQQVLDHPEQYVGIDGSVRELYSSDIVARQYEALFQELIGRK